MIHRLQELAVSALGRHPYGYVLGLAILESHAFFLPHEPDFYAFPLLTGGPSGLFLDVGANRGHSALGFHKLLPGWRALSIEANPLHAPRLGRLKQHCGFLDYRIAAADRRTGDEVTIWTPFYKNFSCHSAAALERPVAVLAIEKAFPAQARDFRYVPQQTQTLALDDLNLAPQIIKLDVQGNELAALEGLTRTIESHRPSFLIECDLDTAGIFAAMRRSGYEPLGYRRARHRFFPLDAMPAMRRNTFFVPRERACHLGIRP